MATSSVILMKPSDNLMPLSTRKFVIVYARSVSTYLLISNVCVDSEHAMPLCIVDAKSCFLCYRRLMVFKYNCLSGSISGERSRTLQ